MKEANIYSRAACSEALTPREKSRGRKKTDWPKEMFEEQQQASELWQHSFGTICSQPAAFVRTYVRKFVHWYYGIHLQTIRSVNVNKIADC